MTKQIAFLRGINVGGSTMLPMKKLAELCSGLGLENVRTYINSGNVLFESPLSQARLTSDIEKALAKHAKRDIKVILRSLKELEVIVAKNPFPTMKPSQVGVLLSKQPLNRNLSKEFSTTGREVVKVGKREVYIHYPGGMGRSKLKWPKSLEEGTVRNLNTIAQLVGLYNEKKTT